MKLILPIFLLLITPILSDSLSELNKKGVNAIYKKEFEKAVSYFQESLKISERDAKANYNLACTYSLMIQKDFCTNMELIDKVFFHLSIATKEDSYYKSKMLKDSDLEILKSNYSFYKIAGLSNKEILEKVTWNMANSGGSALGRPGSALGASKSALGAPTGPALGLGASSTGAFNGSLAAPSSTGQFSLTGVKGANDLGLKEGAGKSGGALGM